MYRALTLSEHDEPALRVQARVVADDGSWSPMDLTGVQAITFTVKPTVKHDDSEGITLPGIAQSPYSLGYFVIQVDPAVTANPGQYVYKIRVIDTGGHPRTVRHGALTIAST